MRIWLHHSHDDDRFDAVSKAMDQFGTPRITVFRINDQYFIVDGVHRLIVAHKRAVKPEFVVIGDESYSKLFDEVCPPDDGVLMGNVTVGEFLHNHVKHIATNECPYIDFPDDCPCYPWPPAA